MAKFNINEENDKLASAGTKAVSVCKKASSNRKEKLKDLETKKAVLAFIFSGDTEAVSPLEA